MLTDLFGLLLSLVFGLAAIRLFGRGEWSAGVAAIVIAVLILLASVWLDRFIAQQTGDT